MLQYFAVSCSVLQCLAWIRRIVDGASSTRGYYLIVPQNMWMRRVGSLQCVAVCCSVLQCVAVCCMKASYRGWFTLHTVAQKVYCSVLQCVAVCCSVLQCVAVCCSVLQCVAVYCIVVQCAAACCNIVWMSFVEWMVRVTRHDSTHTQHTPTHRNTPQHTATHYNTLQHTATHCHTLQHTATHFNTPQRTATHCNTLQHTATHILHFTMEYEYCHVVLRKRIRRRHITRKQARAWLHTATHTAPATHSNTPQHSATH